MKYRISRYWNRLAFAIVRVGLSMVWDQTGRNDYLLDDLRNTTAEQILCDRV